MRGCRRLSGLRGFAGSTYGLLVGLGRIRGFGGMGVVRGLGIFGGFLLGFRTRCCSVSSRAIE